MNKLEELRKRSNMSQNEVAILLDMSQTNYRKIEKGLIRLNVDVALKLIQVFEVNSIEDLLDKESLQAS